MNIVSGNCAGTFSGFLAQLAWMETAEKNPEINLALHTRNKTHYPGNSYSNYRWFSSTDCNNINEVLGENILFDFFEPNEYMTKEYPEEFTYFETYPADIKDQISNYPEDTLKYDGRGGINEQYYDLDNLSLNRNAFYKQWNKFSFSKSFAKKVEQEEKILKGKKVLCLMLRQTEHYIGYKYGGTEIIDKAIDTVKSKLDDYDSVLLTTQVGPFLDKFIEVFGNRCIYADRPRFDQDIDWKGGRYSHISMTDDEYELEYENAMLDVILSSKTDLLIGGSSNMFLAALGMNPQVSFDMFCSSNGL